jgi:hypothetical protein
VPLSTEGGFQDDAYPIPAAQRPLKRWAEESVGWDWQLARDVEEKTGNPTVCWEGVYLAGRGAIKIRTLASYKALYHQSQAKLPLDWNPLDWKPPDGRQEVGHYFERTACIVFGSGRNCVAMNTDTSRPFCDRIWRE